MYQAGASDFENELTVAQEDGLSVWADVLDSSNVDPVRLRNARVAWMKLINSCSEMALEIVQRSNAPNYAWRDLESHYRAKGTREILRLSHEINGKTMEPGGDSFKFTMEVDRLAADLHRLGDKSVTELRKYVIIVSGLSADFEMECCTRSLRHALRICCQAHNALQVAPAGGPHNEALVTNLERATKLLHITPALLQSSDGRCSRQGRYNEYARGELTGIMGWLVVFAGRSRQKAREDTPEARRIRASKLAHQRGGITKGASALISPPAAPRDSRTLATLRGKYLTEDPAAIATGKA